MNWLSPEETAAREPHVRSAAGALESPRTGIVDSHALMQSLLGDFEEAGGDLALGTAVKSIKSLQGGVPGYMVTTPSGELTADVVINAAGLGAIDVSNTVLPEERRMRPYFCKGTYFSYSKRYPVNTLIYPAPVKGFGGLGTHLTLDISGRLKFGPDVEWVDAPTDLTPDPTRMAGAIAAIQTYMPDIDRDALTVDYCGIRPKIKPQSEGGVGQVDFIIRMEKGFPGFVNLLGIESPGKYTYQG
jgi:L-2-hydroxyglutarate oxidase LhgO